MVNWAHTLILLLSVYPLKAQLPIDILSGAASDTFCLSGIPYTDSKLPPPFSSLVFAPTIHYRVNLQAGVYFGWISFVEPNKTAPGQRLINISINGQNSTPIDVFSLAGGADKVYKLPFLAWVPINALDFFFTGQNGQNAIVSGISIAGAVSPAQLALVGKDPLNSSFMPPIDTDPTHYPGNIWVTGPLAKVQPSDLAGKDHSIVVKAAKNEIASFQAHVQGSVGSLSAALSDLVNTQTGEKILASSTDIIVYREVLEHIQPYPTATGPTFLWSSWTFPFSGFVPDALIPAVDPYYHQKTNAFPVGVAAGQNQSVWVDVHVPPGVSSGYYGGTFTFTDGNKVLASIPIVYEVYNRTMPSTASLPSLTAVGYGSLFNQTGGATSYPNSLGFADFAVTLTNADLATQFLDNRYSVSYNTNIYPGAGSFSALPGQAAGFDDIYGPLLDGAGGRIHTILPGAKLTSFAVIPLEPSQFNGPTFQNFADHFKAKGWSRPIYGLWDEPNPLDSTIWASLVAKGTQEHSFSLPRTPNYVTTDLPTAVKNGADKVIDRFVLDIKALENYGVGPQQDLKAYAAWIAQDSTNRSLWAYHACSDAGTCANGFPGPQAGFPNSAPNYDVDGTPIANRIMEWLTYFHGQTGELYYATDHMFGPGGDVAAGSNPWISNYYSGGWGDGTLVYPGGNSSSPCAPLCDIGVTVPIWIPSIRLKMIRDGMQDYEYMNALVAAGKKSLVDAQVANVLKDSYHFTNDPSILQGARDAMGLALHQLQ